MNTIHLLRRHLPPVFLIVLCGVAFAQMPPGGGDRRGPRAGGMADLPRRDTGQRPGPPVIAVTDPLSAFERELPSLRVDLKLTPEQVAHWDSFARALRDAAEAGRGVARLTAGLRTGDDTPALGKSLEMLGGLASQRAWALNEASRAYAVLEPRMSPEQVSLLSRRFRQAATDPLGP
ncbi:MAG: hypothetical protein JNM76_06240 [Betaproteobacteria bacterium]|nr:hypothetical protein [Betaproteobacteria bacterium]